MLRPVLLLLALGACAPTLETHLAQCQGYGYTPGTDAMAACVQNEQLAYDAKWQQFGQGMMIMQQGLAAQEAQAAQQRQLMMPQRVWVYQ